MSRQQRLLAGLDGVPVAGHIDQSGEVSNVVSLLAPFGFYSALPLPEKWRGVWLRYVVIRGNVIRLKLNWSRKRQSYHLTAKGDFVLEEKAHQWAWEVHWYSADGEKWSTPNRNFKAEAEEARPKWIGCTIATDLVEYSGHTLCKPFLLLYDGERYPFDHRQQYCRYLNGFFHDGCLSALENPVKGNSNHTSIRVELPEVGFSEEYEFIRYTKNRENRVLVKGNLIYDLFGKEGQYRPAAVGRSLSEEFLLSDKTGTWDIGLVRERTLPSIQQITVDIADLDDLRVGEEEPVQETEAEA